MLIFSSNKNILIQKDYFHYCTYENFDYLCIDK